MKRQDDNLQINNWYLNKCLCDWCVTAQCQTNEAARAFLDIHNVLFDHFGILLYFAPKNAFDFFREQ